MTNAAVSDPQDEPPMEALEGKRRPTEALGGRRRRNVRLFLIHLALALGFLVAFVWAQVHR